MINDLLLSCKWFDNKENWDKIHANHDWDKIQCLLTPGNMIEKQNILKFYVLGKRIETQIMIEKQNIL